MLFNSHFILASTSRSRFKILKNNNLNFIKIKPSCNESLLKKLLIKKRTKPSKISLELARLKSKSISVRRPLKLVVGSDTVIVSDGILLNKARNMKEAKEKIFKFSGKKHHIYSSASVFYNKKEIWKFTQKSTIKIRVLEEGEIDKYLAAAGRQILSSVGCYQVELLGPNLIEEVKGDLFNVMGFPLFPFLNFLKKTKVEAL
jgi:septum formation protein